jgi:small subunit ribosomal protein S7
MPPRLNICGAGRSLAVRVRPSIASHNPRILHATSRRGFADEKAPKPATDSTPDTLGNVNEEAVDIGDVTGETKPDLGQGTPVQEVRLKIYLTWIVTPHDLMTLSVNQKIHSLMNGLQILERDEEGRENAPQVIKDEIGGTKEAASTSFANLLALGQMENIAAGGHASDAVNLGHKFGIPELPLPSNSNLKHRYDPVVSQVTNLLMKDGKLSVAQRVRSSVSLLVSFSCHRACYTNNFTSPEFMLIILRCYRTCHSS